MKKIFLAFLAFVFVILFVTAGYTSDRFTFNGREPNGCEWWIDEASVKRNLQTEEINYWCVQTVSSLYRKQLLKNVENELTRDDVKLIERVEFFLLHQYVDTKSKFFCNKEVKMYDSNGFLLRHSRAEVWYPINPTSPVEGILIWMSQNCPAVLY